MILQKQYNTRINKNRKTTKRVLFLAEALVAPSFLFSRFLRSIVEGTRPNMFLLEVREQIGEWGVITSKKNKKGMRSRRFQ
jgi:hypothetical protein